MIDILYLAHNRLEYTKLSLDALIKNTNWDLVNSLHIYADNCNEESGKFFLHVGSEGTEVMFGNRDWPHRIQTRIRSTCLGSPVAVMKDFLSYCDQRQPMAPQIAPVFAKIDNDLIVPPGWLEVASATLDRYPAVDLLGIEPYQNLARTAKPTFAQQPVTSERGEATRTTGNLSCRARDVILTDHIGGIGLFRRSAFEGRPLPPKEKVLARYKELFPGHDDSAYAYFGLTEWQWHHADLIKAWLAPALPCFLLDHLPFEPFLSLNRAYEALGWQRKSWGLYSEDCSRLWEWRFPD
jgi:hypothetical protein